MDIFFGLLSIIAAALLILLVVVQNSKGGGLSSAFGASNLTAMIGTRRATQDIEKFTWYMALILFVVAFVANVTWYSGNTTTGPDQSFRTLMEAPVAPAQPQTPDVAPMGGPDGQ